jgi:hypothetical protein
LNYSIEFSCSDLDLRIVRSIRQEKGRRKRSKEVSWKRKIKSKSGSITMRIRKLRKGDRR